MINTQILIIWVITHFYNIKRKFFLIYELTLYFRMIKFGLFLTKTSAYGNYSMLKEIALTCEKYHFDSMGYGDRLIRTSIPHNSPFLECWTISTALLLVTKTLRVGPLVLCNSFRHPSVVAKMAATLDVISQGRLEFGIGAGWYKDEYDAYGIPFYNGSIRIQQLEEAVQIIRKMWTEDSPSFEGAHYFIKNAINEPKPIQSPHPPIMIGTNLGGPKMLNVIAKLADSWNLGNLPTPKEFANKLNILKKKCHKVKRDPNEIENSTDIFICLDKEKNRNLTVDQQERGILGSPNKCIEKIEEYLDVGVTSFIVMIPDATDLQAIKSIGEEIIPYFKNY